ncbi:MAG: hypothetical protein GXO10_07545 [Crenarchaeota archaeon]|nr:hypothetical protein [Thermoproteota archaeon]
MVFKCSVPDIWTVEPAVFFMGNKYHPCAVLVPLDDEIGKEIIRHVVDMGVAIAGFCKTANIGLEKVICNVLANPNIRWIVVAGRENPGHRSGKAIVMLSRYGVDPQTRRIMCGSEPCRDIPTGYIPNLPLHAIERFRRQIKVVDVLIDGKEVTEENVLELTCMAVYGTIQEPKNMIKMYIKGVEYRLFDPGAFDSKPFKVTITDKDSIIESVGEDHVFIRAYNIEEVEKELKKLIKNNFRRNILIIYGKVKRELDNPKIELIKGTDHIMIIENYLESTILRIMFINSIGLERLISFIRETYEKYMNSLIIVHVPKIVLDK